MDAQPQMQGKMMKERYIIIVTSIAKGGRETDQGERGGGEGPRRKVERVESGEKTENYKNYCNNNCYIL